MVRAVLTQLARVGPIHGDELLVQQFICLHMTELRVDKSVNIMFIHSWYIPTTMDGLVNLRFSLWGKQGITSSYIHLHTKVESRLTCCCSRRRRSSEIPSSLWVHSCSGPRTARSSSCYLRSRQKTKASSPDSASATSSSQLCRTCKMYFIIFHKLALAICMLIYVKLNVIMTDYITDHWSMTDQ